MKNFAKFFSVILLMIFSFGLGALFAAHNQFGAPFITVELENLSSQKITSVVLENENGSVVIKDLDPKSSRRTYLYVLGESGGYRLNATFEDGHVISGGPGYVEAGYCIQEKISENSIKNNPNPYRCEP